MVTIKNLFVLVASVSAAVVPRSAATILSDLETLDSDVNVLASDVSVGSINSFAIAADVDNVLADLNDATTDTDDSAEVTGSRAATIVHYIENTLAPDALSAISALERARTVFISSFEGPVVLADLRNLRAATADLGTALSEAVSDDDDVIDNNFEAIDNAFARAIVEFE